VPLVTDQPDVEMVAPPAEPEVVAESVSGEMVVPELVSWAPGLATVTTLLTVQLRTVVPWKPAESVAWTVAE